MRKMKENQQILQADMKQQKSVKHLKSKLTSALSMLLVAALLMSTVSYAWLTMSVAPEVTGVATNIGANGSLEIALLTTQTRNDLQSIKTTIGSSLTRNDPSANNTWGNVLDLSYSAYGLKDINLLPARLNVQNANGTYSVDSGLLSVPTYGFDGRITSLSNDTVSAIYSNKGFASILGQQDYGVRAIGTADNLSAQASALAIAKSNITTYNNSIISTVQSTLSNHAESLLTIVIMQASASGATYSDKDLQTIKDMIEGLKNASNYIELSLRQGILAVAASTISDTEQFELIRTQILDQNRSLSNIIDIMKTQITISEEFTLWVEKSASIQNNLNSALSECNKLTGNAYTWNDLKKPLNQLMNTDKILIGGKKLNDVLFGSLIGGEIIITLPPESGVFADIADFAGNYEVITSSVTIRTTSTVEPFYLKKLATNINGLDAAAGGTNAQVVLSAMYGYALDMAFRCNASLSDLLLQTSPEQRVYEDSTAASTLGGGSYMEFATDGGDLLETLKLIDAVRVAFIDDQGNVLGVAKPNTSNRNVTDTSVKAPLFLYDFSIDSDGAMVMGERQKNNNVITSLEKNTAKAITVVVWLDGDQVDNTMVSAESETTLNGKLNLQFSSSADLIPVGNESLKNLATNKNELQDTMNKEKDFYSLGQRTYTTASWREYEKAYNNALTILEAASATQSQVYQISRELALAKEALEIVSKTTLQEKIAELRQMMGETSDVARYVIIKNNKYVAIDTYTSDEFNSKVGELYRVDYAKNLRDEGNGLTTPIYTDNSWQALAAALYDAEVVAMDPNADDSRLDAVLSALTTSYKLLQHRVFYFPYDYNGSLYYFAISDEEDTYGKWYDGDFRRIVADVKILELDAYAKPATIASVEETYISNSQKYYVPSLSLSNSQYPTLYNDEIIAINWKISDAFIEGVNRNQIVILNSLIQEAGQYKINTDQAQELVDRYEEQESSDKVEVSNIITATEARKVIGELASQIQQKKDKENAENNAGLMSFEQRSMLTVAVTRGNIAVQELEDKLKGELTEQEHKETSDALKALETAINNAQAQLNSPETSKEDAEATLTELNKQLVKAGQAEVTLKNGVYYSIPVGSERYDIAYEYYLPQLWLNGNLGETQIEAVILTRNGVVYTITKNVTIYSKAEEAAIVTAEQDTQQDEHKLNVGQTMEFTAKLLARVENEGEAKNTLPMDETIVKYNWSSSNEGVFKIDGMSLETCEIRAIAAGTAELSVVVETLQGNTYTASLTVVVE